MLMHPDDTKLHPAPYGEPDCRGQRPRFFRRQFIVRRVVGTTATRAEGRSIPHVPSGVFQATSDHGISDWAVASPLLFVVVSRHVPSRTRKGGVKVELDIELYSSAVLRPLTAACVFRDCSLRLHSVSQERRACRTLMREAAVKWRRGLAMGDL